MADDPDSRIDSAPMASAEVSELCRVAYPELRRLAHARLRGSAHHTLLDTTGLVSEAYTRMAETRQLSFEHRGQFFSYCARVMRSIIVDLAREARAVRNGGGSVQVTLSTDLHDKLSAAGDPLQIDEALTELAKVEPRLAAVVEMRFFAGYSEMEIAASLSVAERTVRRDWERARILLRAMLSR